jgi:branched-chain amino acid transport system substrate-binding protein
MKVPLEIRAVRQRRSGVWPAAVTATTLVLAVACGGSAPSTSPKEPFRVGVIMPLSGAVASIGNDALAGIQTQAALLNQHGGIMGRQIEVDFLDDAGDPNRGRAAAQDLIENKHVSVMFDDVLPPVMTAALPLLTQAKVLAFSGTGNEAVADPTKYPYQFTYGVPFGARPASVVAALKKLGATRVAIMSSNDSNGTRIGDLNSAAITKAGLTMTGYEKYDLTAKDVTPQLQKLKNGNPDTFLYYAGGTLGSVVLGGVRDLGWNVRILADPAATSSNLSQTVPQELSNQWYGVAFSMISRTTDTGVDPTFAAFAKALKDQNKPFTNLVAPVAAADQLKLIKWAYEKAGKDDAVAATKALESLNSTSLPKDYLMWVVNPRYSSGAHTAIDGDFKNSFALIRLSTAVDGTYKGQPLPLT